MVISSLTLSERVTSPVAGADAGRGRGRLVGRTVPVSALDAATRDAAFALFHAAYENTSRERFKRDLAEKQYIILLYERTTGALKGFSTVLVQPLASAKGAATVVFSGDTVIDAEYWGQKQLQLAFARLILSIKLRAPWHPVYWFLVSKGYRTYLLLANAFPHSVPRAGAADDPALRMMLDELASARFGAQYDRARGVVRYATAHERVRDGVAPVTPDAMRNSHVQFFVERNPEYAEGVELACLAEIRLMDLTRAVARIVRTNVRRTLRGAPAGRSEAR